MAVKHSKLGGESPKEEIAAGIVIKLMTKYFNSVEDKEHVQNMLRNLPPIAELALDPLVRHTAFGIMSDFGRPELARALKDIIESGAHHVEDMVHDAKKSGRTSPGFSAEAFEAGGRGALERKYAVQGRLFHSLEPRCGELPLPRPHSKGKDGDKRPQPLLSELPLAEAIRQRYFPCQFCITVVKEMKLPGEPVAQKKLDGLEIIANCKDADARKAFDALFSASGPEDKRRILTAVRSFLGSESEFIFMTKVLSTYQPEQYPAFVNELEALLRLDEGKRSETQNLFGSLGGILQGGGTLALDVLKQVWDDSSGTGNVPATQTDDESDDTLESEGFGILKTLLV